MRRICFIMLCTLFVAAHSATAQRITFDVHKRNVLKVEVLKSGAVAVDNKMYSLIDLVRGENSDIAVEVYNFLSLPYRSEKRLTSLGVYGDQKYYVSKGIVLLCTTNGANEKLNALVKDVIMDGFNLYRNDISRQVYGKPYSELNEQQARSIRGCVPTRIHRADDPYGELRIVPDTQDIAISEIKFSEDPDEFGDFEFSFEEESNFNVDEQAFIKCDVMPTFKGGDLSKFRDWVQSNVRYPQIALENGIQGNVVIKFIVEKDGSVSNIQVLVSPDKTLSDAAVAVFQRSPKWVPGKEQNEPVRVTYTLPVSFKIQQQEVIP